MCLTQGQTNILTD